MTALTVSPTPRSLTVLVAAIALAGVPVAAVGGIGLIVYPAYAGTGALLAIRRPRNPIGWLLIGLSWAFLVPFVPVPATAAAFQAGTASPFATLIAWSSAWVPTTGFALLLIVMIIFPAGRLPTGRWRGPAIFAIAAASLSTALASFAQGQTIAVAASTLAAFAVLQPVLHHVRRDVNRRFDRARYDAEQMVAAFSDRLRHEVDIATVMTDLDATVQVAVKPASLRLWIRETGS